MTRARNVQDLELAYTVTYSVTSCVMGVVLHLSFKPNEIDWDDIHRMASKAEGLIEDSTSFEIPNLSSLTDDSKSPLPDRWTVRFAAALQVLKHHIADFAVFDEGALSRYQNICQADSGWAVTRANEISDQLDKLAPFYAELRAYINHADFKSIVGDDVQDDPDFRPIGSFPLKVHGRIRQAALADRKTKRVRKRNPSGEQTEYSYADAMKWWPRDMVSGSSAPR